jgi:hypothetical protein
MLGKILFKASVEITKFLKELQYQCRNFDSELMMTQEMACFMAFWTAALRQVTAESTEVVPYAQDQPKVERVLSSNAWSSYENLLYEST